MLDVVFPWFLAGLVHHPQLIPRKSAIYDEISPKMNIMLLFVFRLQAVSCGRK